VTPVVRGREATDLDACTRLAEAVHRRDGYPVHAPEGLRSFVGAPALAAWVATRGDEVVGHVALRTRTAEPVMALARRSTGWPAARFGVVARLLVAPGVRRLGVGRSLLETAEEACRRLGRHPLLDVTAHSAAAIGLYEACGWRRLGRVTVTFSDHLAVDELVYLGPGPAAGTSPLGTTPTTSGSTDSPCSERSPSGSSMSDGHRPTMTRDGDHTPGPG
jgi:[ribosomal protein S18]-alanine N-acetyltransferase